MSGSYLLSHRGCPLSTIGVGRLNFRVRDGNGWDPSAITTGLFYCQVESINLHPENCIESFEKFTSVLVIGLLSP